MPTPTTYIETIKDAAAGFNGATAPSTGQYYSQIYSQNDPNTGVPTLGVTLYNGKVGENQPTKNTNSAPVQLNNLTDMQILEMVQSGKQVGQNQPTRNTESVAATIEQPEASTLPLGGIFILVLLLFFVGFVYFLIRIWQDYQAQKLVMTKIKNKSTVTQDADNIKIEEKPVNLIQKEKEKETTVKVEPIQNTEVIEEKENWRIELEQANTKLTSLLNSKNIAGETASDKLKAIKPGQFALADMAWEAQQGAKKLLTAHKSEVDKQAIKRVLQLFKQVFAEHKSI